MEKGSRARVFFLASLLAFGSLLYGRTAAARDTNAGEPDKRPERLVTMAAEYPGVQVATGDDVSMDIIFENKGRSDESVDAWVASEPKGWKARLKTYRYTVSGVYVPSGEKKTLTFEAVPDQTVKPGTYPFLIKGKTPDGKFQMDEKIEVTVKKKEEGKRESQGVRLSTSYPVLRGPSDVKFEFSIEVQSKLDKDAVFGLFAQGPEGWEVNFKPAYESKYISSIQIKANQSQTVSVEVKPPANAKTGEYPIPVRVTSGDAKGEVDLTVALTGTYALEAGTPTGLLSLDVRQGKTANLSFYVRNSGSAANHDIRFVSVKPENWKVEFKPEKVDVLEPGDLRQVEMIITAYEEALVGDYSVAVNVQGEKATKDMEFRVTVKTSAAWGWIGVGIIALVVIGLTGLFRWLGRR